MTVKIFGDDYRTLWDKNILKCDINRSTICSNLAINYQLNKSPLNFSNRDFVDKQIVFSHDKKIVYSYFSFVPNCHEVKPLQDKVERAKTIIGM